MEDLRSHEKRRIYYKKALTEMRVPAAAEFSKLIRKYRITCRLKLRRSF